MTDSRTVQATETSLEIMDLLREMDGARVSEVADELDLAPSSVHAHLTTLRNEGYLVRDGDAYRLSLKLFELGTDVVDSHRPYTIAREYVERLIDETGLRANFVVEERGRAVHIYRTPLKGEDQGDTGHLDPYPQQRSRPDRMYLHSTAAGKAILAALPDERVDAIIEQWGLPAVTTDTITDAEELFEELRRIERQGYALNLEESVHGVYAVASPVVAPDHRPVGALSIAGTSNMQIERFEELADTVRDVSNDFELRLAINSWRTDTEP